MFFITAVLASFILTISAEFIYTDEAHTEKCAEMDSQLEACLAYGYNVKWIKCASRHFAIKFLDYDDDNGVTVQNAHQVRPGMDMKQTEKKQNIPRNNNKKPAIGNAPRKSASELREELDQARNSETDGAAVAKRRRRELVSPTQDLTSKYDSIEDKLTVKEKRGCRGIEKKIKKNCAAETKYSCVTLQEALGERRRKIAELHGVMPGGSSYAQFNDPFITEAIKRVIMEFKRRAYSSGNMSPSQTIIIGEVDEVSTAIVAGQLYTITMNIGITDNPTCKSNTYDGIVPYKRCPDLESLGKGEFTVVYQSWSDILWKWFEYKDLEGKALKETYWDI